MDERTMLNGLKRISGLKGALPTEDRRIISEAHRWIFEHWLTLPLKEARLLSLEEIQALPDHAVVWEEVWCEDFDLNQDGDAVGNGKMIRELAPVEKLGNVMHGAGMDTDINERMLLPDRGCTVRYWLGRPTESQMEGAAWPDDAG